MRLIDADALIEKAKKDRDRWTIKSRCSGKTESALFAICLAYGGMQYASEMETVESVPVKHGHWTNNKGTRCAYEHSCSLCGFGIDDFDLDFLTTPVPDYCPSCGALMDKEALDG